MGIKSQCVGEDGKWVDWRGRPFTIPRLSSSLLARLRLTCASFLLSKRAVLSVNSTQSQKASLPVGPFVLAD